jgi:hypothetical protein
MTLLRRGRRLFKGGEDDEDIPSSSPLSPIEDVAVQEKPNEVRIGPMTRARAKLLEQQVNSLLIEYDVCDYENFILPKSMHLCMIRFVDNTSIMGGEEQQGMEDMDDHMENIKECMEDKFQNNYYKCSREEREAGAQGERHESWRATQCCCA